MTGGTACGGLKRILAKLFPLCVMRASGENVSGLSVLSNTLFWRRSWPVEETVIAVDTLVNYIHMD